VDPRSSERLHHQMRAGPGHVIHRTRPRAATGQTVSTTPFRTP